MFSMSTLIALTYDNEEDGRAVFGKLAELQKDHLLELEDAALAVKDAKGKVKVKQTLENQLTGTSALWGGFWGLLIGLLFLAPIFWGLFGALMGFIAGKTGDVGIDNKFIKDVGNSLDPGGAAVFMLVIEATTDKVLDALKPYGGHVFQTSLSKEDEDKLKTALEHEQVAGSADESLDLEPAETQS
jgi:uncharacterized membrane protein